MVMQQQATYHHQQQSYQNNHPSQQEQVNHYAPVNDDPDHVPKRSKKKKVAVKKEKVEKPPKPPKVEKIPKPKKEKKIKVNIVPEPDEDSAPSEIDNPSPTKRGRSQIEPTRSSGRARAKCVNYNEDAGEDEFYTRIERRIVPKHSVTSTITSPSQQPDVEATTATAVVSEVPPPQQSPSLHPPIVLRISKVSVNICFAIT